MPTALETAIEYARRGYYVFPIQPGKKVPFPGFSWTEKSTNDPEKVKAAGNHPTYEGCNWALDTGKSGVTVVDSDDKPDRTAAEALATLPEPLVTGLSVASPRDGIHLLFTGTCASGNSKLAPGIDVKSAGGYVLIPGSVNGNGKPYRFIQNGLPAPLPEWVRKKMGAPRERKPPEEREAAIEDLDQDHHIKAVVAYLTGGAPEAIQGDGGDTTTYEVACRVRDLGVSLDMAVELMEEHWNEKATPPWSGKELRTKIENAYRYARDKAGNATPEALFPDPLKSGGNIFCSAEDNVEDVLDREWMLGYRCLPRYVTVTVAPGGVGKSLLTILEGLSVASGKQLTHSPVRIKGNVWLHNTEDPRDELRRRILAAAKHHRLTKKDLGGMFYSSGYDAPLKVVVLDAKGQAVVNEVVVASIIRNLKARGIRLFILDPLVGAHGIPENDNQAMELVMQVFRRIAQEADCAISLVHHVTKGKAEYGNADKARGASALINAARIAHTIYPMDPKDAKKYGLSADEARWYVRLDDAKSNLAPPGGGIQWYKKISVQLRFDSVDTTGVLEAVELEEVVPENEGELLVELVANEMSPGRVISAYALAQKLKEGGFISGKEGAIQRKVERAFAKPVEHLGLKFRTVESETLNGRKTIGVECSKAESAV